MKFPFLVRVLVFVLPAVVYGQSQGVTPEWDIKDAIASLRVQVQSIKPYIEQLDPASWNDQNAPEAYENQWRSLREEIGYFDRAVGELSENPGSLAKSVESFLRMLSVEEMMDSFLEGVRRYHNSAVADQITGIMNEGSASRAGLRRYLLELATVKENECNIALREAQQCRMEQLSRPPSGGR